MCNFVGVLPATDFARNVEITFDQRGFIQVDKVLIKVVVFILNNVRV